jgi:hypothetical protein
MSVDKYSTFGRKSIMKIKSLISGIAIMLFALALLFGVYLNALNHRYTVLLSGSFVIMDNWTKRPLALPEPHQLHWKYGGEGSPVVE